MHLSAFETISFVISVRLSVCTFVRRDGTAPFPLDGFGAISYLRLFQKSAKKIQVSLESDKNKEHFTWKYFHICDNISLISS
jgi:hypothetical protein